MTILLVLLCLAVVGLWVWFWALDGIVRDLEERIERVEAHRTAQVLAALRPRDEKKPEPEKVVPLPGIVGHLVLLDAHERKEVARLPYRGRRPRVVTHEGVRYHQVRQVGSDWVYRPESV